MGGVSARIDIEPLPGAETRSAPSELLDAISDRLVEVVWEYAGDGSFRPIAGSWLRQEASDAAGEGLWFATPTALRWSFVDHAGTCGGSSSACHHWFEVALRAFRDEWDRAASSRGWRLAGGSRTVESALLAVPYPLVDHGGQLLCVPPFRRGVADWKDRSDGPFWDQGSPRPRLPDFTGAARDRVFRAAMTGRCDCGFCDYFRPWADKATSSVDALCAAWVALADEGLGPLVARVRTEVATHPAWSDQPEGPEALRILGEELRPRIPRVPNSWELAGLCWRLA